MASDKARFYLEQSVPELNELERKGIFTKDEISSIAKKRSEFEHILNARGSHPSDYMRYVEYELNLLALRKKRIKRLGIKAPGSGPRRVFMIFSRGTRKFPGNIGLWMQYIEFARKEKAFKKLNEILTSVVRLHPTKPELWIYAAHYYMDTQADITNARSFMQRSLRFCKSSKKLWLEYAKLETIYIGKIAGRRKILGLDNSRTEKPATDDNEDMIALPSVTAADINPGAEEENEVNEAALKHLADAPVLTGAIPIAIFDAAVKQFEGNLAFAADFFDMFSEFGQLPCLSRLLQHVFDHLLLHYPLAVETAICAFRMPLIGVSALSPAFPAALRKSLDSMSASLERYPEIKAPLSKAAVEHLLPILRIGDDLDAVLRKVLKTTIRKYTRLLDESEQLGSREKGDSAAELIEELEDKKRKGDAKYLMDLVSKQWHGNNRLRQLQTRLTT